MCATPLQFKLRYLSNGGKRIKVPILPRNDNTNDYSRESIAVIWKHKQ